MGIRCKSLCFFAVLLIVTLGFVFLVAIRHTGAGVVQESDEKQALRKRGADIKRELFHYVHFNHPPPLKLNPYSSGSDDDKDGDKSSTVCALEFIDETNSLYQLVDVEKSQVEKNSRLVLNHDGACGVCSSLHDYVAMVRIKNGVDPKLRPYDFHYCMTVGFLSRDWGVECFRNAGFTAPCAELLYYRAGAARNTCIPECISSSSMEQCITDCDASKNAAVFTKYGGRDFGMDFDFDTFTGKLPQISKSMLEKAKAWEPPQYDDKFRENLRSKVLIDPPTTPSNPYWDKDFDYRVDPNEVCGAKFVAPENEQYKLVTYKDEAAAEADGAYITHKGGCGYCSSLRDLEAYIAYPDMTYYVRNCAIKSFISPSWSRACLWNLGLSLPCAEVWYRNARHTREKCLFTCLWNLRTPNNAPDGSLSSCIACDEELSGPVFKKASARTRRNSGLFSAINRPGPSVYQLVHEYPNTTVDLVKPSEENAESEKGKDEL